MMDPGNWESKIMNIGILNTGNVKLRNPEYGKSEIMDHVHEKCKFL